MSVGLTKRILLADFVFTGVLSCEHYPLHRNSPLRYVAPTLVNHQTAFHFKKTCKTRYTHLRRALYRQRLTPLRFYYRFLPHGLRICVFLHKMLCGDISAQKTCMPDSTMNVPKAFFFVHNDKLSGTMCLARGFFFRKKAPVSEGFLT